MSAGFSLRGLLVALGIVALGLPAAFAGLFGLIAQIAHYNAGIVMVREAQLNVADLLRLQSDEQTDVRGYAATNDPTFRESFRRAASEFPVHANAIAQRLGPSADDARAGAALDDARSIHTRWSAEIAQPVLSHSGRRIDDRRAIAYVESFRSDLDRISAVLIEDYHRLIRERSRPTQQASFIAYGALAVVALQILVFAFLVDRLRGELVRERGVITLLQSAFTSEIVTDPHLDVAAVYVSATRGATVGGDVYDIFPLDAHRSLVVIADVSGKGVAAAVDSTFVKYSLRAFASEHADVGTIVTMFNALYDQAHKPPEAFVVLFAGIVDTQFARVTYVNAGHEAAYVRRPDGIEQLAPTGPIIGLEARVTFRSATASLTPTDLLFLSTDGMTEARDPSGAFLGASGVESWLRDADAATPQHLVSSLALRLKRYTRDRNRDDLAILAVRPRP